MYESICYQEGLFSLGNVFNDVFLFRLILDSG